MIWDGAKGEGERWEGREERLAGMLTVERDSKSGPAYKKVDGGRNESRLGMQGKVGCLGKVWRRGGVGSGWTGRQARE